MKKQRKNVQDMKIKNRKNSSKGITLIALVISIIVLLILAGVSIATLTGENGILTQAQKSKTASEKGETEDKIKLVADEWQIEKYGADAKNLETFLNSKVTNGELDSATKNADGTFTVEVNEYSYTLNADGILTIKPGERATTTVKDNYTDETKTATIPAGYTVSNIDGEKTIDGGLVIYEIPEGTTISNWNADTDGDGFLDVQENYNQFVWVPVDTFNEFVRHDFGRQGIADSNFINTVATDGKYYEPTANGETNGTEVEKMYKSVKENKGFYIGRYEASNENNVAASKKGKAVWNNIKWGDSMTNIGTTGAVYRAQNMYAEKSTLCYGVQWDAVMRWISRDEDLSGYLTNSSGKGNYKTSGPIATGSNPAYQMKNIYDMAGNVWEWTMEACDTSFRVVRGGNCNDDAASYPVTYRYGGYFPYNSSAYIGFRVALYV